MLKTVLCCCCKNSFFVRTRLIFFANVLRRPRRRNVRPACHSKSVAPCFGLCSHVAAGLSIALPFLVFPCSLCHCLPRAILSLLSLTLPLALASYLTSVLSTPLSPHPLMSLSLHVIVLNPLFLALYLSSPSPPSPLALSLPLSSSQRLVSYLSPTLSLSLSLSPPSLPLSLSLSLPSLSASRHAPLPTRNA